MGWLLDAHVHLLGADILWREIIGNGIGLASAVLGMSRRTAAWPVGMTANVLLVTVFLGGVFATPQDTDLYGQAGRQVLFFAVSGYGWWRWHRNRAIGAGATVEPRWATGRERATLLVGTAAGVAVAWWALSRLGSFGPLADAWIFVGSMLATYGMARGLVEFWLVWVAVDAVGVPLLLRAGYYPSALLYVVYGAFCIWGFRTWLRLRTTAAPVADPELEAIG